MELGPILWLADRLLVLQQRRRRVRVLVHRAFFLGSSSQMYYFVKVSNLSASRDIEITHVWFAADPPVHLLMPERPLPARLRPEETWEGWVRVDDLAHATGVERLARVRLASGKTVKSRPNKDVPPVGYVAGGGTRRLLEDIDARRCPSCFSYSRWESAGAERAQTTWASAR